MPATQLTVVSRPIQMSDNQSRKDAYYLEVVRLREELDEANAKIAYLKEMLSPPGMLFPARWKLTEKEARCLRALMASVSLTKEQLLVALYDTEPEAEIKIVDVFVCKLRTKIARDGLTIETMWGSGYRINPSIKEKITDAADHARQGIEWMPGVAPAKRPNGHLSRSVADIEYTGAELRAQRHALNLSQESVRKLAGLAHSGFVSTVESGASAPKYHRAVEKALRDERRKRCIPDPAGGFQNAGR